MTQTDFYKHFPVDPDSKEQRLVLDLRCSELSWDDIYSVFAAMTDTPYKAEWQLRMTEEV